MSPTCVSRVTWGQVTSIPQVSSVPKHKIKHISNDMKSTGEALQKAGIPQRIVQKERGKLTKARNQSAVIWKVATTLVLSQNPMF
jgi:hypothetical protein